MTYDHLMPIFFQDAVSNRSPSQALFTSLRGGLGISTQNVGLIMSVNGVIALFVQGVVFPLMASWLGVWRLFIVVTVGHPLAFFIVPFLVLLPPNMVYVGIYACLFVRNLFSILAYPLLLILIKEASPAPAYLGKINGLAASVGGACRTVASPVAGFLYGIGSQVNFAPLPWWASGLVAVVGALQMPWIERQKNKTTLVRSAVAWRNDNGEGSNTGDGSVRLV
jgi:MFS family permease